MNKKKTILWIAGWASDFRLWENEILEFLPNENYEHTFCVPHAFDLKNQPSFDFCIAWSLGAHYADKAFFSNLLLVHPAIDFCGPKGIPLRVLKRMQKRLLQDPKKVLNEFALNMGFQEGDPKREKWVQSALSIDVETSHQGLQQLENKVVPPAHSKIMIAKQDQITPLASFDEFREEFEVIELEGSHLPAINEIAKWVLEK